MTDVLGHAIAYAERGLHVFPLVARGKTPLTQHGLRDGSIEPEAIASWWASHPDANIGIRTGAVSNVVVLDVDGPEGEASLQDLPPMPDTWCALTSTGAHFYFSHPGHDVRNSAGRLGPGLDVRGDGGYVVAPPSIHPDGTRYVWAGEHRKLAPWPSWLEPAQNEPLSATESLRTYSAGVTVRGDRYAAAALAGEAEHVRTATVGTRNDALNRAAFAVARFVATGELRGSDVAAVLTDAAVAVGLPEHEARRTIASAFAARSAA
jgi:hypothetical protein